VERLPRIVIGQGLDQMQELGHRARVAVRNQQRFGAGLGGFDVQEVDALTVNGPFLVILAGSSLRSAPRWRGLTFGLTRP
jgi:hypothetical protein